MNVEERIIELVKPHPVLYDVEHKNFGNVHLKMKIWSDIAKECQLKNGEDAKRIWVKLRDAFRSSIKRVDSLKINDSSAGIKLWKFYEQMTFLKPYMRDRKRQAVEGNQAELLVIKNEDDESGYNRLGSDDCEEQYDSDNFEPKRKMYKDSTLSYFKEERRKVMDEMRCQRFRPPDDLKLFFDSMYETTKKFTPALQREVKRKLFTAVSDAEDIMDKQFNGPSSSFDCHEDFIKDCQDDSKQLSLLLSSDSGLQVKKEDFE